jgi:hypothetical protein
MKKKILKVAVCLLLLGIISVTIYSSLRSPLSRPFVNADNTSFLFDSSIHTIHSPKGHIDEIIIPQSFEDMDSRVRANPLYAIVIGEVAGFSINRIISPFDLRDFSRPGADNHVITPMLVHKIIYIGDEIRDLEYLTEGELVDVREGYYYITEETQAYRSGKPLGDIETIRRYWPMESGNLYLMYLYYYPAEVYQYNGEVILSVSASRTSVYQLSSSMPDLDVSPMTPNHYPAWWQAAIEKYGHLADEIRAQKTSR